MKTVEFQMEKKNILVMLRKSLTDTYLVHP